MFGGGLLVPIFQPFGPSGEDFAFALFDENSFSLIIPLSALGGDDSFDFALSVGSYFAGPTDCAPNGGFIRSSTPTKQPAGDTDGDGCTDAQENGFDETLGGRRDYLNFWDFFDPNRDRSVGLLDFLAVLRHFGATGDPSTLDLDAPEPPTGEYWALADRGGQAPGGDPWDELPANGSIGLSDFLSLLRQFGHTCA